MGGSWLLGSFTFVYKLIKDKNRDVLNVFHTLLQFLLAKEEWGETRRLRQDYSLNNKTNLSNAQTLRDGLDEPIFFTTSSFPKQPPYPLCNTSLSVF